MKIILLVASFPPKWLAGTEIATYNLAKNLALRGHEVHVLTPLDKGLTKESKEQGFFIHRILSSKIRIFRLSLFWTNTLFLINKLNPDIVHAQNIRMAIPAFFSKIIFRKPYIVWGRGSDVYLPWILKKPISTIVLNKADAIIALTEDMRLEILKICDRAITVIPNGIDTNKFNNLTKEKARAILNIALNDRVLIFVGRLNAIKGVKYLIQATALLNKNNTNFRLMIIGDGPDRQELEIITDALNLRGLITFVGQVNNDTVPKYMIASDIFILPSISESFGIVNLEAMASGLPIIATKVGGLPEIIEEGKNGFLVTPRNPEQLANKIHLLLNDDNLRYLISTTNKIKAKSYSWEEIAKNTEAIYLSILNS